MARTQGFRIGAALERISYRVTVATGSSWAFAAAALVVVVWLATGPLFHYSDTWQLVINTSTTIVTFLMVFLIQRSQNKDTRAIHLKLNELVAAMEGASNRLVDVEDLTEEELETLHRFYAHLAKHCAKDVSITESHSIDAAARRHERKLQLRAKPDASRGRA
ncbi:MAG TPA: low affinity iron permease family protein [Planctomycetota bacterium]|nr:low affinity iron permease family protein [Planctomycetota bacterium]